MEKSCQISNHTFSLAIDFIQRAADGFSPFADIFQPTAHGWLSKQTRILILHLSLTYIKFPKGACENTHII